MPIRNERINAKKTGRRCDCWSHNASTWNLSLVIGGSALVHELVFVSFTESGRTVLILTNAARGVCTATPRVSPPRLRKGQSFARLIVRFQRGFIAFAGFPASSHQQQSFEMGDTLEDVAQSGAILLQVSSQSSPCEPHPRLPWKAVSGR
jgi:hypothetical protein